MNRAAEQPRGPFAAWARVVTARPWVTLGVVAVLAVAALLTALQLEPATGVRDMLADDQPAALAFGQVIDNYALVDDLIVLARLPEDSRDDISTGGGGGGGDPERLIAFAQRLEAQLKGEPMVADVRVRESSQVGAFIENVVVPHGLYYLDDTQRVALLQRLTPGAMDEQFRQNAAMLAAPGPAAGRLAKELIRDPLRLRDFLAEGAANFGGSISGGSTSGADDGFMEGVDAMVSRDGRAIMVRVAGVESANDLEFTAAFMPRVRAAVDAANADPANASGASGGLRIDYTGAYAIAELSASQTRADMMRSCTGSIVLLVVLFLLVYRNPLALAVLTLPVYLAIVLAFGLYVGFSGRLTPVTAVAGAVLAGLGIDYCVHVLAHHEAELRRHPTLDDRAAGIRNVASLGPAITAACVTSLIGFGAILGSSVRSLREFAMLGMLGLAMALLASVTILPALLAALGHTRLAKRGLSATRIDFAPPVTLIVRAPGKFLLGGVTVLVLCAAAVFYGAHDDTGWHSPIAFDSDLHALHPRPHPPLDTQETLAEIFGAAPNTLMILVDGRDPDDMVRVSHRVQGMLTEPGLRAGVGVAGVIGPASLLPEPNRQVSADRGGIEPMLASFRGAADAHGFNAGAFSEYEDFLRTLLTSPRPTVADVWAYPEVAGMVLPRGEAEPSQGLVLVTLDRPWLTVADRDQAIEAVRGALSDLPGATLTGISVIGYDTQHAIAGSLWKLLLIAAGLVLVWLVLFFRRPADVALALLPAVAGLLALVTCAELLGWTLNAINLIALPLIVGIGVDDGIFLVAIARRCQKENTPRGQFVDQLAASGHAIVMTSLTTGLAFGSLAFTSVPAIRSLGWFTAVGVGAALAAALGVLVPALVMRYRGPGIDDKIVAP